MPDEPDKLGGEPTDGSAGVTHGGDDEVENERPTVSPPFDPIAFARDVLKPSPAPMRAVIPEIILPIITASTKPPAADPHTKATPPQGVEQQAAVAEMTRQSAVSRAAFRPSTDPETRPPPETPGGEPVRRKTPTSTISLANARIPSNLPPRLDSPSPSAAMAPVKKYESLTAMNAVDREWADIEIATRPPPADGPGEDPVVEIAPNALPTIDLDDLDLGEHDTPTAAPPPPDPAALSPLDNDHDEEEHGAETVRRPVPQEMPPESKGVTREREMNDRVSLGDYSGALEIAEKILADDPTDPTARACAENCRVVLRQMYATRIGPLDRVPVVMVARDQLRWLSIDHKAGFVLSLVDGVSTLEMIIDVSGMPELDTLRILSELAQQRIISLR